MSRCQAMSRARVARPPHWPKGPRYPPQPSAMACSHVFAYCRRCVACWIVPMGSLLLACSCCACGLFRDRVLLKLYHVHVSVALYMFVNFSQAWESQSHVRSTLRWVRSGPILVGPGSTCQLCRVHHVFVYSLCIYIFGPRFDDDVALQVYESSKCETHSSPDSGFIRIASEQRPAGKSGSGGPSQHETARDTVHE